ncbi:hypothetical protein BAY61_32000 (plasmid) [Prauserella marina]|uniref:Scr1 family TA system antitoxin-like transcriptional regulator n=1 Tax=Prauserella marina TaxID=530584 RepID=UPI000B83F0F3|nr:Scr1 family TA system antitoxin-like transcriptional regulator [Prauserella marina]ASR39908.1 hypothetical protein BAY61_32000 [Prauserella marina]
MGAARRLLARALLIAREDQDMTQVGPAARAGLSRGVLGHIERGRNLPSEDNIRALTTVYGVPERTELLLRLRDIVKARIDTNPNVTGPELADVADTAAAWHHAAAGIEIYAPGVPPAVAQQRIPDRTDVEITIVCHLSELRREPREALAALLTLADTPQATVQVVPDTAGPVPLLSAVTIWTFDPVWLHKGAMLIETGVGPGVMIDQNVEATTVAAHRDAFHATRALACDPAESRARIAELA